MWHVSSRSGAATLRTAIHLLPVTYSEHRVLSDYFLSVNVDRRAGWQSTEHSLLIHLAWSMGGWRQVQQCKISRARGLVVSYMPSKYEEQCYVTADIYYSLASTREGVCRDGRPANDLERWQQAINVMTLSYCLTNWLERFL